MQNENYDMRGTTHSVLYRTAKGVLSKAQIQLAVYTKGWELMKCICQVSELWKLLKYTFLHYYIQELLQVNKKHGCLSVGEMFPKVFSGLWCIFFPNSNIFQCNNLKFHDIHHINLHYSFYRHNFLMYQNRIHLSENNIK